jgi:hypothetical protein
MLMWKIPHETLLYVFRCNQVQPHQAIVVPLASSVLANYEHC